MTMTVNTFTSKIVLTSLMAISSLTVNPALSFAQSNATEAVTFKCVQIHDPASNEKIPATIVWIPEAQKNVRLIGWKSDYFDKTLSAEQRCQKVTQKFQTKYDNGDLQYISFGQSGGYPILCGVKNIGDPCNGNSQLFQLKPHNSPQEMKKRLEDILSGQSSDMLMQSSGEQAYVPFADLLNALPDIEVEESN
jgi:hypothetical protein